MKDSQPTVELRPSVCPLDCPDTCSLSVELTDGQITAVRGSKTNPFTAGAICKKVMRSYAEFTHGADRLMHPLRRDRSSRVRAVRTHLLGGSAGAGL